MLLLGIARVVRDYREVGGPAQALKFRKPNSFFEIHPECGPNLGFVLWVARSHNGCGIRKGSEITVDVGDYVFATRAPSNPSAKNVGVLSISVFKGHKQLMFSMLDFLLCTLNLY